MAPDTHSKIPHLPGPPPNSTNHPVAAKGAQLIFPKVRLTFLTPSLVRIESSADGTFEDRASTFALNRNLPVPKLNVEKQDDGGVVITTEQLRIIYDGKDLTEQGFHVVTVHKIPPNNNQQDWRWGHNTRGNLGGTARTLDGVNGRVDMGDGILSRNAFALIDDSTTMLFTPEGWVDARIPGRSDHYLFGYGADYQAALKDFYRVSGDMPVVPRWALGNWWSRYHRYTDEEYLGVIDRFNEEKIPLSVGVLDMDWHLVDEVPEEYGGGWTGYTWNKKYFPDPKGFLKRLHDRNVRITPNTHPADGFRAYEDVYKKACEILGRDPSTKEPIEFDCTSAEFMSAYFDIHHVIEEDGIDFWWLDWQQGSISKKPGIDPLWVLNHYHFWDSGRKGLRPVTFTRYGGPGGHRYPIGFSGDTVSTWESLEFQAEFTSTAANVGFGWWSHDIGGHYGGYKDPEMYTRWVHLGLWSPVLRLHSTAGEFNSREPWVYNEEARRIATESLRYRHRLIPYLYTMSVRAARDGRCLVEPMYHRHPLESDAYANKTQFFFGTELIVAPILKQRDHVTQMGKTEAWLPKGEWVDIFTNTVYDGGRIVKLYRLLEQTPVLAKAGAILPLDLAGTKGFDEKTVNDTPIPTAIEVVLVVGADGHFELLEDDGSGADLAAITFSKTPITYDQAKGRLTIGPTSNPLVKDRKYHVRLPAFEQGQSFKPTVAGSANLAYVGEEQGQTVLHIDSVPSGEKVEIDLGPEPQLRENDLKSPRSVMHSIFQRAVFGPEEKDAAWNLIQAAGTKEKRHILISQLEARNLDPNVKDALLEQIMAS
ncbi:glycosyl hydrolases family 31-domain-containing protein [Kockovaella imperatae]|uniref:Glycosyl hydrolases family 31-domain-containing protein n=1 Tax=Kockovaella imperatae TaxID=4999 RepID=A0A1Y1UB22_9TREE|nr:glycosyl hydrolases family 31-domain-containing protein [Kockovaella imperatae]ORX35238.1 glycosyl hydrolases family 31-domain-containing protein [Kockovaella imperatae]